MPDLDVQLLPEHRKKIDVHIPGENRYVIFGCILTGLVIATYAGSLVYKNSLVASAKALDQQITDTEARRDQPTEDKLILLDKRLQLVTALLNGHLLWSEAFTRIESLVEPEVQLKNFSANVNDKKFTFKGETSSFPAIAHQIAAFLTSKELTNVALDKVVALPTGRLEFNMSLRFDPTLFLRKTQASPSPTPRP